MRIARVAGLAALCLSPVDSPAAEVGEKSLEQHQMEGTNPVKEAMDRKARDEAAAAIPLKVSTQAQANTNEVLGKLGDQPIRQNPDDVPVSKTRATIGRIVLVYSEEFNLGPYPADVVSTKAGGLIVNVNLKIDGEVESRLLEKMRERMAGNTFADLPLFDPLTPEQRTTVREGLHSLGKKAMWCEWMPYQQGQAQRTDAAEGPLNKAVCMALRRCDALETALCHLAQNLQTPNPAALQEQVTELLSRPLLMEQQKPGLNGSVPKGLSVAFIAAQVHELWRASGERSYSPYNKPWDELTNEQKQAVSRNPATVLKWAKQVGAIPPQVAIHDEFAPQAAQGS